MAISIEEYRDLQKNLTKGAKSGIKIQHEELLHLACFDLIEKLTPQNPILNFMFHTPNGGLRHKVTAKKFKEMGVRKGVPDLLLPFSSGIFKGLMIEFKYGKNGLTLEQEEWIKKGKSEGWLVDVVKEVSVFDNMIRKFLSGKD